MVFGNLGGIYYTESYEEKNYDYGGAIPCFIGRTINPQKDWTTPATVELYREKATEELYKAKATEELANATPPVTEPTTAQLNAKIEELKADSSKAPTESEITAKADEIMTGDDTSLKPTENEITARATKLKEDEVAKHRINELQLFTNFSQVNKTTLAEDGKLEGLGSYNEEWWDNPLLSVIHDFCEEADMMTEEFVACPYFYVIDLGLADTLDQWIASIETSKIKKEIDFEVYVGFDRVKDTKMTEDTTDDVVDDATNWAVYESFILAVNYDLVVNRQYIGDFRKAFYTVPFKIDTDAKTDDGTMDNPGYNKYYGPWYYKENYKAIDKELIKLATDLTGLNNSQNVNIYDSFFTVNDETDEYTGTVSYESSNTISKSRTYIIEPLNFGYTIGRIATTPYDMEPGYYEYNMLDEADIIMRRPSEQLKLQVAGVIFNHLEETSDEEYIKINRTQAVSSNLMEHPPDALYQARHLCDELLTRLFDTCYPQLKNKETETNIDYLQTEINKVVNDAIGDGDFIPPYTINNENKGTQMTVSESDEDAYDLQLNGTIQPVNCTYTINIIAQINDAKVQVRETES